MAYKHVDPPIGMCQYILYMFTNKRHVPIRNWDNTLQAYWPTMKYVWIHTLPIHHKQECAH
jgi:hypothetical protein